MQQINGTQKELASDITEVIHLVHTQNFQKTDINASVSGGKKC